MQNHIHLGRARPRGGALGTLPRIREGERVAAAALEARAVAGRQRGRLIEEEHLGVAVLPDVAMPALELEQAADPRSRSPAPQGQRAGIGMDAPAAIAHEQAERGVGKQFAEWRHAIGQRHAGMVGAAAIRRNEKKRRPHGAAARETCSDTLRRYATQDAT